jgi:hypothetical protein
VTYADAHLANAGGKSSMMCARVAESPIIAARAAPYKDELWFRLQGWTGFAESVSLLFIKKRQGLPRSVDKGLAGCY